MSLPQTVTLDENAKTLDIIDQTLLPQELRILKLCGKEEICEAIKSLRVRGAPAIGVAAAIGLYCICVRFDGSDERAFIDDVRRAAAELNATRPTARNLSWALERAVAAAVAAEGRGVEGIKEALKREAFLIKSEDIAVCRSIGEYGETLISDGDTVMTVCNAGALAAVEYGTALAPIYAAKQGGKAVSVYALETRPLLQGARLTAYELTENGVDTTVICDNMAASVLATGRVKAIFTGTDRVAANGDAANKVGTLMLAVLAKHFSVPFYICAPYSSVDFGIASGKEIVIEQRDGEEIRSAWYKQPMITGNARIFNPAFDVTPAELITAFVTENGIRRPTEL